MNKLLIAALVSLSFTGAIAQEATYDPPSPIVGGKNRAEVRAELTQARLDGTYFAGGEHSSAALGFVPSRSRAEVVAELNEARLDGTAFVGGEASHVPSAHRAAAATAYADAGDTTPRVEIVASSAAIRAVAFVGGEATPDVPQRTPVVVSRGDVIATLERSHADGSYFAGGEASLGSHDAFPSTLTRAEVNAAVARSHADGTYWSGGESSPMPAAHEVLQPRAGSVLAQTASAR